MNTIKNILDETNFNSPQFIPLLAGGVGGRHFINLSSWKRREHYEVFKNFDEPLFGITVRVECADAYRIAKEKAFPFSLYYLYLSMKVANEIEEFRYRIEDEKVVCYDSVGAGPTIFRADETYGCGYFPYSKDIEAFMAHAKAETERVKDEQGLNFPYAGENIIHYSTLPWADFTAVNHARILNKGRSIPKITFGKITRDGKRMSIPVDVHVNHALMDGFHVGKFIERFQELLSCPLTR